MTELTTPDLFFIITGSAVIIVTVLLAIGLLYVIMFVRTVKRIAHTAQKATEMVSEDLADLSKTVREKGFSLSALMGFAKTFARKKVSPRSKK